MIPAIKSYVGLAHSKRVTNLRIFAIYSPTKVDIIKWFWVRIVRRIPTEVPSRSFAHNPACYRLRNSKAPDSHEFGPPTGSPLVRK